VSSHVPHLLAFVQSYYDRLMQLAAENGEKDAGRQQALDAARAESARLAQGSAQGTRPAASPAPAGTGDAEAEADVPPPALSFLSPPKPKLRVQVEKALDAVPPARKLPAEPVAVVEPKPAPAAPLEAAPARAKAPAKEAEVQAADSNLRLLKVSARGPKPMPAPWEGVEEEEREGNAEAVADTAPKQQINAAPGLSSPGKATKKVAQSVANIGHVRPALAVPASPVVKSSSGPTDAERAAIAEVESLKAALAEALAAKEAAVAETAAVRAAMAELQSKLEEAEEEAKVSPELAHAMLPHAGNGNGHMAE